MVGWEGQVREEVTGGGLGESCGVGGHGKPVRSVVGSIMGNIIGSYECVSVFVLCCVVLLLCIHVYILVFLWDSV